MSHKGLREPHVLLASSNPQKLIRNLQGVLDPPMIQRIVDSVSQEVRLLYRLGVEHYTFATTLPAQEWRQKISRLYYAAYNVKRSISLCHDGAFSTDSKDHGTIDEIPDKLNNYLRYKNPLRNLRDDRNLSDYGHLAVESDLLLSVSDAQSLVTDFLADAKSFLASKGVAL